MPIRVAHLSQSDLSGGAAISAYRLHRGLLGEHVDSRMMVHHRVSDDPEVVRLPSWHRIWRRVRQELEGRAARELNRNPDYCAWSLPLLPGFTSPVIGKLKPDVINLHAVDGICAPWDIGKLKPPVVWTVHDEWAASAGFHFWVPRDEHFLEAGPLEKAFSGRPQRMLRAKLKHWKDKEDLVIVSPSRWLAGVMASAPHFAKTRIEVIPYGIETATTPLEPGVWRDRHGVSASAKVIGYGAAACLNNFRK
ncbi:MAG TPA: glycosyltransferase, partial [Luteolibacter sp.]